MHAMSRDGISLEALNELMSQDLLKDNEAIRVENYETPMHVVDAFGDLPSLKAVSSRQQVHKSVTNINNS